MEGSKKAEEEREVRSEEEEGKASRRLEGREGKKRRSRRISPITTDGCTVIGYQVEQFRICLQVLQDVATHRQTFQTLVHGLSLRKSG
jgi:hypothetical protein